MAGISKLVNMGLLGIVGGGDNESLPFGLDSGALGLNNSRIMGGKPWAASLLDGGGNSTSIRAQPPPIPRGFLSDWIPPAPQQVADEKRLDSAGFFPGESN
jgi:hypothetical protein